LLSHGKKAGTKTQMNESNTQAAVSYLLERAQNQEIPIGKTRLIKLLYLLDIEIYRAHQRLFTELDWIFYKYGPFSFDVEAALSKLDISEDDVPIRGSKIFRKVKIELGERTGKLDIEIKAIIEKLLEDWGTADFNELLDYVYFETEPMIKAAFKQRLDFTLIKARRMREERIVLSKETEAKLQDLGKRLCIRLEEISVPDDPLIGFPADFIGRPDFLKDEMADLSQLIGRVKVKNA